MKLAALAIALATLAGCGGAPAVWVGKWTGDRHLATPPAKDPSVARTLSVVELEVRSDGSCEIVDAGIALSGRARFSGNSATVRIDRVMDRPPPPGLGAAKMTLERGAIAYVGPLDGLREPLRLSKTQPR